MGQNLVGSRRQRARHPGFGSAYAELVRRRLPELAPWASRSTCRSASARKCPTCAMPNWRWPANGPSCKRPNWKCRTSWPSPSATWKPNLPLRRPNFNRRMAAQREVDAVQAAYDTGNGHPRRAACRPSAPGPRRKQLLPRAGQLQRSRLSQVHFRKGSLLEYNGVYLAEGPWPGKAYFDARRRARARDAGPLPELRLHQAARCELWTGAAMGRRRQRLPRLGYEPASRRRVAVDIAPEPLPAPKPDGRQKRRRSAEGPRRSNRLTMRRSRPQPRRPMAPEADRRNETLWPP